MSTAAKKRKIVACRRCHIRKIKCSGESPCRGCISTHHEDDCIYVSRSRKVKVTESYLQQLMAENERFKEHGTSVAESPLDSMSPNQSSTPGESLSNPLIQERAWFMPPNNTNAPIYIAEAACTAFATRFRQSLAVRQGLVGHVARTDFIQDENLLSVPQSQISWPSKTRAQLLLKVALANINRAYHVVLPEPTLAKLDQIYQEPQPRTADTLTTCKLFALFALGDVYSSKGKSQSGSSFPGLLYFMYSCSLFPLLPERAKLDHIEISILLSFFSHNLNRRNSAYFWIGSALRLSLTCGLHHELPSIMIIDPVTRQHRIRLWWTIYICDRMWNSKLGHPLMIQDRDITVELPSIIAEEGKASFPDPGYIIASIKLAKIAGCIISNIYCRGQAPPFIQSVQQVLRDLQAWMSALPESIRLAKAGAGTSRHVVSLHLSFNQCVILATRPVLLYVFKAVKIGTAQAGDSFTSDITPVTSTLVETCLHTARHSNELLTQLWIDGTLSVFGYFDAQYLFSSAVILAISSISDVGCEDNDSFESAAQLLQTMADSGNLSAIEFCGHLAQVRSAIDTYRQAATATIGASEAENFWSHNDSAIKPLTTEMALLGPPMQEFLTQEEFPFEFTNQVDFLQDSMLWYS